MSRTSMHALLAFILLLFAVNILLLDIMVFSSQREREQVTITAQDTSQEQNTQCATACQQLIDEAIAKITPVSVGPTTIPVSQFSRSQPVSKEFYIPLGSGTTKNADYEELLGAEAYINRDNYPGITQVTFEVFLRNPTGNGRVYAKLYNVTDKHDVWYSEIYIEGNGVTRKETDISLEPGNKLYRVMLKSTLRYDAYVDAARIKIITQ